MKIPLKYQSTEYDCGPTTLMNAMNFLFEREKIPPEVIRHIMLYTLDMFDRRGEAGKSGTSGMAMQFLTNWLNHYNKAKRNFPIAVERLTGSAVHVGRDSRVTECLRLGGAAIARVHLTVWHYVLFTGVEEENVLIFDPYFRKNGFGDKGIQMVEDQPCAVNRRVARTVVDGLEKRHYAFGPVDEREAVLMYNQTTRRVVEEMDFEI